MATVLLVIIVNTVQHLEERVHVRFSPVAQAHAHLVKQVAMALHFVVIILQTFALF